MEIFHNSWNSEYRKPFGAALAGSEISIGIDIREGTGAAVYFCSRFDDENQPDIAMKETRLEDFLSRFSCAVKTSESGGLLEYFFRIEKNGETLYYGNNEEYMGGIGAIYHDSAPTFQITVYTESKTPAWYKNGIVYQIFPDRFYRDADWKERCESGISEREKRIGSSNFSEGAQSQYIENDWNNPAYYTKDDRGNVTSWQFFGGSLRGIKEKLHYLKSLGVTAVYLNPIFEAVSNHRYDTADYFKIDPILGTEEDFINLAAECKKLDIHLILDGVFSHTGSDSIYFDKYGNYGGHGAFQNPDSEYRDWYDFTTGECGYKSWWGIRDLPEVNELYPSYREMICSENGVLNHWLRCGASGFRLDVADELPDDFIKAIRKTIKKNHSENLLIGEVWEDASNKVSYGQRRKYLMGDELDSVMNYPLRQILLDYVNYTISSSGASGKLMSMMENYPPEALYGTLNILGSHDRERILTMMAAAEDYNAASKKVKLLSTAQYTLPGVPCIYYGDEIGMTGGNDPENRKPMAWEHANMDLHYHYRMLGLIYDEHPVLKNGEIHFLSLEEGFSNDDVLAFTREDGNEKILVLINRSYGATEIDLSNIISPECGYALELLKSEEIEIGKRMLEPLSSGIILLSEKRTETEEKEKRTGVICHISSLPGGNMGSSARQFVDWMAKKDFRIWQVLPLNPNGVGDCPYNTTAAFAGNPDFICRDELPDLSGYEEFLEKNLYWLQEYADFVIAKSEGVEDPEKLRDELFLNQYYFDAQWKKLKAYANSKNIEMMGDLPIYVSADGADVFANPQIFILDEDKRMSVNAGVPPDDFAADGQNWGLALYDWKYLKETGYDWWMKRILQCAERYDILRLDHFRGFSEYFAIPAGKKGKSGNWQHGPGLDFFVKMKQALKEENAQLEILAEDLGLLDAGVLNLLKLTGFKGMDIWQFSEEKMMNMNPEEVKKRAFYTGTHDNHTLVGWLSEKHPEYSEDELKKEAGSIIERIQNTPCNIVMLQLQDVFLLDDSARMNIPGKPEGNWKWKAAEELFS